MKTFLLTLALFATSCQPKTPSPNPAPPNVGFPAGPTPTLQWTQYTGTTTFTVPTGIKGYSTLGCGAGGGGGAGQNGLTTPATQRPGGGAGGGAPLQSSFLPVIAGHSVTVTIPAGGAAGTGNGSAGTAGGAASVCDTTSTFCVYFLGASGASTVAGSNPQSGTGLTYMSAGGAPTTQQGASVWTYYAEDTQGSGGYGTNANNLIAGATSLPLAGTLATWGNDTVGYGTGTIQPAFGGASGTTGTTSTSFVGGGGGGGGGAGGGLNVLSNAGGTGGNGGNGNSSGTGSNGTAGTSAAANSCSGGGGGGGGGEGSTAGGTRGNGGAGGSGFVALGSVF